MTGCMSEEFCRNLFLARRERLHGHLLQASLEFMPHAFLHPMICSLGSHNFFPGPEPTCAVKHVNNMPRRNGQCTTCVYWSWMRTCLGRPGNITSCYSGAANMHTHTTNPQTLRLPTEQLQPLPALLTFKDLANQEDMVVSANAVTSIALLPCLEQLRLENTRAVLHARFEHHCLSPAGAISL